VGSNLLLPIVAKIKSLFLVSNLIKYIHTFKGGAIVVENFGGGLYPAVDVSRLMMIYTLPHTLYSLKGSRDISDIPLRRPHVTNITIMRNTVYVADGKPIKV
jgi:hypothetical protein